MKDKCDLHKLLKIQCGIFVLIYHFHISNRLLVNTLSV